MNRIALLPLVALAPLAVMLAIVPACGDACEDLSPICERCSDATTRASCDATVRDNVQDVCSARESLYERDCPQLLVVASTGVGPVTNASNVSTTAGPGGAGGQAQGGASSSSAGGAGGQGGAGGN